MKEKKGFGKIVSIVVIAVLALIVISNSLAIIPT